MGCQMDKRETNSDHEMEKKIICRYSLLKKIINPRDYFCNED